MYVNIQVTGTIALKLKVEVDRYRRIIHLLEPLEIEHDLRDGIEVVQEAIIAQLGLDNGAWSWYLYRKSGTVSHLVKGDYYYVPLSDVRIQPSYIGEMLIRLNRSRMLG